MVNEHIYVMKQRIDHIDCAKAIGMMLIIASHIWTTESYSNSLSFRIWDSILNSFYVPLFFLLSGVFESSNFTLKSYSKRILKLGKFIVIFATYGIINEGIVNGAWSFNSIQHGTLIWFLFTLMWISLVFGYIKQFKYCIPVIIALSCLGCWISSQHKSMFYIGQALLCIPFYCFGYYFKSFLKKTEINWKWLFAYLVIWISSIYLFFKTPQNISLNLVSQNYITFYITAIAGSFAVIELSKLISMRAICWYGRNSIVPMMTQMTFIWIISKHHLASNSIQYILFTILVISLTGCSIVLFRNKYYDIFK